MKSEVQSATVRRFASLYLHYVITAVNGEGRPRRPAHATNAISTYPFPHLLVPVGCPSPTCMISCNGSTGNPK